LARVSDGIEPDENRRRKGLFWRLDAAKKGIPDHRSIDHQDRRPGKAARRR
jgi:hypothetical protein